MIAGPETNLDPYILGTETEYGLEIFAKPDQPDGLPRRLEPDKMPSPYLSESAPPQLLGVNQMLRNGARLYLDVGAHPEYATGEACQISHAVADEYLGLDIVTQTIARYVERYNLAKAYINRRSADHDGNDWGYHVNLLYPRRLHQTAALIRGVGTHAVMMNIFAGSGGVSPSGDFVVAQKSQTTHSLFSENATRMKPIISKRDEPHADTDRYGRLSVLNLDPNMSYWATSTKLGSLVLVMDMIRQGRKLDHLHLSVMNYPIAAHMVARDTTLQKTVRLEDGRRARPLEVEQGYRAAAVAMAEKTGLDPERARALDEWGRALDDLERDGPEGLLDRADWPKRMQVIDGYVARGPREGLPAGTPGEIMRWADKLWDTVYPVQGIGMKLMKGLWAPYAPDPQLTEYIAAYGSPDTRAELRSRLVLALRGSSHYRVNRLDWTALQLSNETPVTMMDPFATTEPYVEKLIDKLQQHGAGSQEWGMTNTA